MTAALLFHLRQIHDAEAKTLAGLGATGTAAWTTRWLRRSRVCPRDARACPSVLRQGIACTLSARRKPRSFQRDDAVKLGQLARP